MSILVLVISMLGMLNSNPQTEYYALTTIVAEVDYTTDTVVCVDSTGNAWAFTGCEDWLVDDVCSLMMCDQGTDNIEDDTIVSVRYSGYTLQ